MKALQIPSPFDMKVIDIPEPEPRAGEVKLKIHYAGFCGSDLNTFRGGNAMAKPDVIPGHEIGATIEALGDGCPANLHVGQAVTVNPYTNCGTCSSCRNGRPNACKNNETLGVQRDGAMREQFCLPWQKVIPVGDIPIRDAALIEPMSVGFHAVSRAQVTDNDTVMVFGCGMVGLGAIIRSAKRGATVIAVDLSSEKLSLAAEAGATYCINSKEENLLEKVMEYTDGFGADVVIEAVGSPVTYVSAIDAVCFTGRVVCIGYSKNEVSFQTKYFVQKELDIRGSRNAMPEDFRAVIRCMQDGNLPVDRFISGIVGPEDAFEAMKNWAADPGKVFRILVNFE